MNFMEAMDAVEAGNSVRRHDWDPDVRAYTERKLHGAVLVSDEWEKPFPFDVDLADINADDWEVVS